MKLHVCLGETMQQQQRWLWIVKKIQGETPPPREDIIVTVLRLINYALKRCVSTLYEAALYLNSMSFRLLPDIAEIFAPRLPNHH